MTAMTKVSAKGQVVIPKDVRDRLRWPQGTELEVVDGPAGVMLRKKEPAIRAALDLHRAGADLAAVFHLVAARGSEAFVTFDRGLKGHPDIGVAVERAG
jgi:AbrB family looped-hinge helix DNA binding protein